MKYRDVDALAYEQRVQGDDERIAVNHVTKKRLKSSKTLEVTFDPEGHKEYITGFQKRKQQRRNKALKDLQQQAKQDRLEFRAQKRAKLKEELGLDDNWGVEPSSSGDEKEENNKATDVRVYPGEGVTTTVTTLALDSGPESSESEQEEEVSDQDAGPAGDLEGQNGAQAQGPGQGSGHGEHQHMSKRQAALARKGRTGKRDKQTGGPEDRRAKNARMIQKLAGRVQKGSKFGRRSKTGPTAKGGGKAAKAGKGGKGGRAERGGKGGKGGKGGR